MASNNPVKDLINKPVTDVKTKRWDDLQSTSVQLGERFQKFRTQFGDLLKVVSKNHELSKAIADQNLLIASDLPPSMRSYARSAPAKKTTAVKLTARQTEVVRLISLGCSMPEIGRILSISTSTADNTRTRAMKRLGVSKAALVTRAALMMGITSSLDQLTSAEKLKGQMGSDGWN